MVRCWLYHPLSYDDVIYLHCINVISTVLSPSLPNQELSGAKSKLQGETVVVCSFYKRGGQSAYNSTPRSLQVCLFAHFNKWNIYE